LEEISPHRIPNSVWQVGKDFSYFGVTAVEKSTGEVTQDRVMELVKSNKLERLA
jgi:hypothetical protein